MKHLGLALAMGSLTREIFVENYKTDKLAKIERAMGKGANGEGNERAATEAGVEEKVKIGH